MITSENFNTHGSDFFESCKKTTYENSDLFQSFYSVIENQGTEKTSELLNREETSVDKQEIINIIFQKIVKLYLLMIFGQFRKDLIDIYQVHKKMAHRKQILVSKEVKKNKRKSDLNEDQVQEHVQTNEENAEKKTKKRKRRTKGKNNDPSISKNDEPPDENQTSSNSDFECEQRPESSCTPELNKSPVPGTSQDEPLECSDNEDVSSKCKKCLTITKDTDWIQCDSCSAWLHRTCAGLKHHMKWKKFNRKGSIFYCSECL